MKSLMFWTERLAKAGCSAFLHCWHSILVASLPLAMWFRKCLITAAISVGDHIRFWFLLASSLSAEFSRFTTKEENRFLNPGVNSMTARANLPLLPTSHTPLVFSRVLFNRSLILWVKNDGLLFSLNMFVLVRGAIYSLRLVVLLPSL